jgi:spermidine/putrescine transport system ATP-binding protein
VREEALNDGQGTAGVADVCLRNVVKIFGEAVAVDDVSLDVHHGEFFSLLGPSGCGKTTTLQMIGGFETPTEGQIFLGDQDVSRVPAYKRDVNTVFQSYALFPHLNIYENIAFGLKRKKLSKAEIEQRVTEVLRLVDLPGYEHRRIAQLSGGQQQRIALARALVNRPRVLLLDEPLGALDLKLRKAMQNELKRIQQDVGITFIYVTHDQEEAMVMSDRLAVMNNGKIEQLGTPTEVYENPGTAFVAGFLGASNLLSGKVKSAGGSGGSAEIELGGGPLIRVPADRVQGSVVDVQIGVRPEKLTIGAASVPVPEGCNALVGKVVLATFIGVSHQYTVETADGGQVVAYVQNLGSGYVPTLGEQVRLTWLPEHTFVV